MSPPPPRKTYTKLQQIALAVAPKCTGFLSAVGALWILIEIATHDTKRNRVFHRLIGAMTMVDLLGSMAFFCSTWPIPREQDTTTTTTTTDPHQDDELKNVIWNIGTVYTCTVQGFIIQFSICSTV
jgi:hypothetical protein